MQPEDKNLLALAHWLTKRNRATRSVRNEAGKSKSGVQSAGGSYVLVNRDSPLRIHIVYFDRDLHISDFIGLPVGWTVGRPS